MAAQILSLIDKQDGHEIVRDKIAAILLEESANQLALAKAAGKDPNLWKLRVFTDAAHPWAEWLDAPERDDADATPIVNVTLRRADYEESKSNVVERQLSVSRFEIDCYGYGIATANGPGHIPGDVEASRASSRAYRLVRNILMAGQHTFLGLRGFVWTRFPENVERYQPQIDAQTVQNIVAHRLTLRVEHNETSPQYEGQTMETIVVDVKRSETGEVFLTAQYDYP